MIVVLNISLILKNYLRSSMSQERLNDLSILSIEKNMVEHIDVDTINSDFAYL